MRTLIVGAGALGGLVGARLHALGAPVSLATRTSEAALALASSGLRVTGVGTQVTVATPEAGPLAGYLGRQRFELIVIATKAQDAIDVAPHAAELLAPEGVLLPIQNGGVAQLLADRLGGCVLGGLSNLGASALAPGVFEQRNAGHLLVGELSGGVSERATRVAQWLGRAVEVRTTANLRGAVWSKLLLNCSVTTLGAIAGCTMRAYVGTAIGRALFDRAYDEALAVALASGAQPEKMLVDPIPPSGARDSWLEQVLSSYGDLKASMLHDFERARPTEIDFINGYVLKLGRTLAVPTPVNAALVEMAHAISRGERTPGLELLQQLAH